MNSNALGTRVSENNRQRTDSDRQYPDRHGQRPTAHLHRQGCQAEERLKRDGIWRYRVRDELITWIPHLNTRVDLTLKVGTDTPWSPTPRERRQVRTPPMEYRTEPVPKIVTGRLIDASGVTRATKSMHQGYEATEGYDPTVIGTGGTAGEWWWINEGDIYRDVSHFMFRLNRLVLKPRRAEPKPPRLNAYVVLEYSPVEHRPHVHALIERPLCISQMEFAATVRRAWRGRLSAAGNMKVEAVRDVRKCLTYNTKAQDAFGNVIYLWSEPDERATWRQWSPRNGYDVHLTAQDAESP